MPSDVLTAIVLLGFTLLVVGGSIMILNDGVIQPLKDDYFDDTSPGMNLMNIGWNVLGTIIFIVGISVVVVSAIKVRKRRRVLE